jgi:hypothetical protein
VCGPYAAAQENINEQTRALREKLLADMHVRRSIRTGRSSGRAGTICSISSRTTGGITSAMLRA